MSLEDLIKMLQYRLAFNVQQRQAAVQRGDINYVAALDADTATSQATLDVLQGGSSG